MSDVPTAVAVALRESIGHWEENIRRLEALTDGQWREWRGMTISERRGYEGDVYPMIMSGSCPLCRLFETTRSCAGCPLSENAVGSNLSVCCSEWFLCSERLYRLPEDREDALRAFGRMLDRLKAELEVAEDDGSGQCFVMDGDRIRHVLEDFVRSDPPRVWRAVYRTETSYLKVVREKFDLDIYSYALRICQVRQGVVRWLIGYDRCTPSAKRAVRKVAEGFGVLDIKRIKGIAEGDEWTLTLR